MACRFLIAGGGISHESQPDLARMVVDHIEKGSARTESSCSSESESGLSDLSHLAEKGSAGTESSCIIESESGLSDLSHLAEKIRVCKHPITQFEDEVVSAVNSLLISLKKTELQAVTKPGVSNASCVRFALVNLLRLSGYDATVCVSKWQGSGKVPGGHHEYIDVINRGHAGDSERLIVEVDFRSHFEIARATDSYDTILNSLPVVYVGSLARLSQYLQVMAEAARFSLEQNSMPLPPWRSLAYLQAKWQSPYQRQACPDESGSSRTNPFGYKQCLFIAISCLPILNYATKGLLLALLLKVYDFSNLFHPNALLCLYCFHIYLFLELTLAGLAAAARAGLGLELEPQFDEPYLSSSLQDFWCRRWNLMVTSILRPTVYDPTLKFFSVTVVGRKWALLPAVAATFAVSALMHELMLYYLGRLWPSWEISGFFGLHGLCLCVEIGLQKAIGKRLRLPRLVSGVLTFGFVMSTSLWLFLPLFLRFHGDEKMLQEYSALASFFRNVTNTFLKQNLG